MRMLNARGRFSAFVCALAATFQSQRGLAAGLPHKQQAPHPLQQRAVRCTCHFLYPLAHA